MPLITRTRKEVARSKDVGRAEALHRSMLALIHKGKPDEAHPVFWAPFVVVGEGGHGEVAANPAVSSAPPDRQEGSGGRKSHAELWPEVVAEARRFRRAKGKPT